MKNFMSEANFVFIFTSIDPCPYFQHVDFLDNFEMSNNELITI